MKLIMELFYVMSLIAVTAGTVGVWKVADTRWQKVVTATVYMLGVTIIVLIMREVART